MRVLPRSNREGLTMMPVNGKAQIIPSDDRIMVVEIAKRGFGIGA